MTGRKTVLATAADSLEANGFAVDVVVLAREAPEPQWQGRPVTHVPLPGLPRVAVSAVGALARRRSSLNESLFVSGRTRRAVAAVAAGEPPAVVVADSLRTLALAEATGAPVLVHLDDLLSERFAARADGSASGDVLGFFGQQLPRAVARPASVLARRLLRTEARLVRAREDHAARDSAIVATTSQQDADTLARRSGRTVHALPMAVRADAAPADPAQAPATSFAFLGYLDYAPNIAALRWWRDAVRPALERLGGGDVTLTAIGHGAPEVMEELARAGIQVTGYVEDLAAELKRHRGFVAPVTDGMGVKTKVLDALAVGLPVVGTTPGLAGVGAEPGREVLVADDPEAFARAVLRLRDDPALAAALGGAGHALVRRVWSPEASAERWAKALGDLVADSGAKAPR
ncbi:MAG TPA: glycosyltransferase family 4 protein [Mycobacteriales bacterium]|nr:glycosyltransferase family 4 protein [Mycobacteriales bacterium]